MVSPSFALRFASILLALLATISTTRSQCQDWRTFPSVLPEVNGAVHAQIVFDDGSGPALYFAGNQVAAGTVTPIGVRKWDGTTFTTVGSGLVGTVYALVAFDAGNGNALYAGTTNGLFRWDGITWTPIPATSSASVACLIMWDDGWGPALFVGGRFTAIGGIPANNIARWTGSVWQNLSTGLTPTAPQREARNMAVHDDGTGSQLYVGGYFAQAGGTPAMGLARWNGSSWSSVGGLSAGFYGAYSITSHDAGNGPRLFICAEALSVGTVPLTDLASWDGVAWASVQPPPNSVGIFHVDSVDLGAGPKLYAVTYGQVYRMDGASWTYLGADFASGYCGPWAENRFSFAAFDTGSGSQIHFGGNLSRIGTVSTWFVRLTNDAWEDFGPAQRGFRNGLVEAPIASLLSHDDSSGPALYCSGYYCIADGVITSGITRWNGTGWQALNSPASGPAGGMIEHDAGSGPQLFAAFDNSVVRWNGSTWSTIGSGTPSQEHYTCLGSFGGELFVGGTFTYIQGVPCNNIARWDGATWRPLATGVLGRVYAFADFDDGTGPALYVGGTFTSASGVAAPYLARWNGTSWSALPSNVNGHVFALCSFDDGTGLALYAGGAFTQAGGMPAARIARWNGSTWSPLAFGFGAGVTSLAAFDDGSGPSLFAGGDFIASGGTTMNHVARWNGSTWSALGNGVGPSVKSLVVHDDGTGIGPELFVGGFLTTAGALATNAIASWRGCATTISTTCFGDGTSTTCPCRQGALDGHGCDNSWSTGGARFDATGSVNPDTVAMSCTDLPPVAAALVFQGDFLNSNPLPFGDGLRCVDGLTRRMYALNATAGAISVPPSGGPSFSARSAVLGDPLVPGAVRAYQVWYRDADSSYCAPPQGGSWNISNAVRIVW